ncbi:uncharacterized protein LOC110447789 [Mizuhopecten yessoensis]|uniref:uncharacterized protein LOC110447789 n=1 Tax=Mizuhopecten yessoensis TaxID=6573 RepID=UPI000B45AC3A|nr:uncharacterized protein LOC110447789 [Mizuhopecten yessoensis]
MQCIRTFQDASVKTGAEKLEYICSLKLLLKQRGRNNVMSNDAVVRISLNTDDIIFAAQKILAQTTSEFLPTLIGITTLVFLVVGFASFVGTCLSLCVFGKFKCCYRCRRSRYHHDDDDDDFVDCPDPAGKPLRNGNAFPQNETFL